MVSEQDEKQRLIREMGNSDNATALAAVEELRERGWLTDGTLHGADLSYANLHKVNLNGASLVGVNLGGAFLMEADLIGTDLRFANLQGSFSIRTYFLGANLQDAILRDSKLNYAIFISAVMDDTDVVGATFDNTILFDVDLSKVKGLESVVHEGPSSISVDTLSLSQGPIPETFLRGCGLAESAFSFARSLLETSVDYHSCFISYSHDDKSFARRVHDTLQGRGIRCWLDEHQMLPGDSIHEEIDRGIRIWDKVLLCCSEASINSWWVEREVNKALQKEEQLSKQHGKKVRILIPLDLDGYIFSDDCDSWIAGAAKERMAANFTGWEHDNALFEREIENVIRAMRTDGGKEPPPDPKL